MRIFRAASRRIGSLESSIVGEIDTIAFSSPEIGAEYRVIDDRGPKFHSPFAGPVESVVSRLRESARDIFKQLARPNLALAKVAYSEIEVQHQHGGEHEAEPPEQPNASSAGTQAPRVE